MELHFRRILTLMIVALSVFTTAFGEQASFVVAIALICLIGIPHGATDHILFFSIAQKMPGDKNKIQLRFYATYLGIMGAYGLLWYVSPQLSFLLFILVSFYHFGQENLKSFRWKSTYLKYLSFMISGVFLLATPLLADMNSAWPIIKSIMGLTDNIFLDAQPCRQLSYAIGIIYGTFIIVLMASRNIEANTGMKELINSAILFSLFVSTPLMMGFAVYFSLWHALPSIIEQINFLKTNKVKYNFKSHIRNLAPYTLVSILGIFIGLYMLDNSSLSAKTGIGFMFLSIITLPHIILMDKFHEMSAEKPIVETNQPYAVS
ncbi:MAG: Brp/Blh family beta-carotene 15,15'-dioxygenase [Bacteroidota bacterium]